MKTLCLVVPCFNEQDVLPMFYDEMLRVISTLSGAYATELVFVNDGSRDGTLSVLKQLAVKDPSVKYISFSRNFGKEAAMLAGMQYAVKADLIGILDADLQHSPDLIPEMIRYIEEEGYDVAAAKRSDREGESRFKSMLSDSFYRVINRISDIEISESAQDFRVMRQSVVKAILSMPEHIRFSKGIFTWVGFNVKWIEHKNRERAAGATKWSLKGLMRYAVDGILGFTSTPLRFSFFFAALFACGTLGDLIWALARRLTHPELPMAVPMICAAVFFAACVILLCIGLLGEYLARVYTEVKDRPTYIIAETNAHRPAFVSPELPEID